MKTFFIFLISAAAYVLLIWYIGTHDHNGNAKIQPLTNTQASSQTVVLVGVAAGMNGSTAIYTPLLYAAAANLAASDASTNSTN